MIVDDVTAYLELRRALGATLEETERLLRGFVRFAEARGETHLRSATAVAWATGAASAAQRTRRLQVVRLLARHLHAEDPRHEPPPRNHFVRSRVRRMPHLYTTDDLSRLLEAASQLGPPGSLRPLVYSTLFGLLACTGLRLSEALRLEFSDLDDDGVLLIRKTKSRKERLVPLHPTADRALRAYLAQRQWVFRDSTRVFVSEAGTPLDPCKVSRVFRSLLRGLGLRAPTGPGPHLHDLRHTFATRSLEACSSEAERVGRNLVALSTYLGHADVSDTFWYLHATPTLTRGISAQCTPALERLLS